MSLASSTRPLCEIYDLAMLDLDGVVYVGHEAVNGASEALAKAQMSGMSLAYVTNNASRNPAEVAAHLRDLGMPAVLDSDVVNSAQAVAHLIANAVPVGSEILVVGGPGLYDALEERGLRGVDRFDGNTVAVVQGFHPDVNWRLLAEGTYAVNAGLPWFASNLDLSVPTQRGFAPGNGALVELISKATGKAPIVAGKPEAALFLETTERVGGENPLVVGDRLDTDIQGAGNVGADSLVVLTGVSNLQDVANAEGKQRASYVAADLRGLLIAHTPVVVGHDTAECGAAVVRVQGNAVVVESPGEETDGLRAAIDLAWTYRDRTGIALRVDGMMVA